MDVGTVVGDTLLAAATVLSSFTAQRARRNNRLIARNTAHLEKLTNGLLDQKIYEAVREELAGQAGAEIRLLLDAIIHHARDDDT